VQKYTFHWEVRDLLVQFLQAFDGAVVKRYNLARQVGNTVGVRYVYAPKQRVLHDLINKAQHITLPAVSYWITSISRDTSRVFNKLEGGYWANAANTATGSHNLQPVPVNIEISVSILTRFQSDMDQILSNFVPYNDPYFIISWERDGMPGIEIRTEVLWSGSLNMGYPAEQNPTQPTRVSCDTTFTIKGWLFKYDADAVGRIFKIDSNFYAVSATPTFQNIYEITDPASTESFVISARPQPAFISRFETPVGLSGTIQIYGGMLGYTNAVFVSGASGMFLTTGTTNNYLSATSLSAAYPPLSGVTPVISYTINSDNMITVDYPAPQYNGRINFLIFNEAGYAGILPNDAI
jgi:hypothetical protein